MGKKAKAKDWKAVTLDYAALASYDDTVQIGVCLTQRQVAILKALLVTAYWPTRWQNLAVDQDTLEASIAQIDYKLDGNDCELENMLFRDNPNDPCEVQYSINGGSTWATMFRKDNCPPDAQITNITNTYTNITTVNNDNTTWAGDILNVAPQWEYLDPDQDNALCWTIQQYVDMICQVNINAIRSDNQNRRDANDWMDDVGEVAAGYVIGWITILSGGTLTFPALAAGALTYAFSQAAEAIFDYLIQDDESAYQDEEAKETIACYMWEQIVGSTPQWPAWRDSLSNWETFGGNEGVIAGAVNIFNQYTDIYIEWMILTEEINSIADVLPPCPCPTTWSHTWNFATHGPDTWIIDDRGTGNQYGEWVEGQGFRCTQEVSVGQDTNVMSFLTFPEAIPRVTTITMTYDCVRGSFDANPDSRALGLYPHGEQVENSGVISTGDGQQRSYIREVCNATEAYIILRTSWNEPPIPEYGYGLVTHVTFAGEGTDPFEGRITS